MPREPDKYREKSRKYICIKYDETRKFLLKQESNREIDKTHICNKPYKTRSHHHPHLLIYRRVITEPIESCRREYDRPEDNS